MTSSPLQPLQDLHLQTPRLVLREFEETDWPELHAVESDPKVVRYMSHDARSEQATRDYIRDSIALAHAQPRTVFDLAVTLSTSGRLVGRMGLDVRRPEHREAEVWFVLHPDVWGHGYATEGLSALFTLAFETLGVHRIFGDCDPRNVASTRVMERLGMRREGHLRENYWLKGEWCDSVLFGLLAHEWRERTSACCGTEQP